jgi:hypothetical protein
MARCWRVLSKPTTPMNSLATKIGTIALVLVPTPSMPEAARSPGISLGLRQTLRPARSCANTLEKSRSSHEKLHASVRYGVTPGPVHSLTTMSSGSPAGPVRVSMTLTRSTRAASPISPSTLGMAPRTSGASRSSRLARAEARSSRSRASRDSLISLSFSAQGAAWASGSSRATFAFISGGTRRLSNGRSESLARRERVLPLRTALSILRGSGQTSPSAPGVCASRAASSRIGTAILL